jgi:hypothetical protein
MCDEYSIAVPSIHIFRGAPDAVATTARRANENHTIETT